MIITTRIHRTLKYINVDKTHVIDFSQAWKMYDASKNDRSFIFYSAPIDYKKNGNHERMWWAETDFGPFVLEKDDDIAWASNKSGLTIEFLKNLMTKTTSDMVFS